MMKGLLWCVALAIVGVTASAEVALAAGNDVSVTQRGARSGGVDWSLAPPDQQPACIMAIGGIALFEAVTVEHANLLSSGFVRFSGDDRVTFTAGDYTAAINIHYQGVGVPNAFGEVIGVDPVDVNLVSSTTGEVVRTTWRFTNGANVGDFGLAPFSLALPNYTDVTCRDA